MCGVIRMWGGPLEDLGLQFGGMWFEGVIYIWGGPLGDLGLQLSGVSGLRWSFAFGAALSET